MILWITLLLVLSIGTDAAKSKKSVEVDDSGELEDDWNGVACAAYENCLRAYDRISGDCASTDKKYDDSDLCYVPIAKQYLALIAQKEKRNKILRKCFTTGKVMDDENEEIVPEMAVGKRKKSTCRHKIAEVEQFKRKFKAEMNAAKKKGRAPSSEMCRAASRRFKDKCHKIENCCNRVRDCRNLVSRHPVAEKMKSIETEMKEERRECKQHLTSERSLD